MESIKIGNNPWNYKEISSRLDEFIELYKSRPIVDNSGGQKAAQLFYSWFVAKMLKPKFIIESGVFKGQGTWAFQQASPDSEIISLDPYLDKWGGYRSNSVKYIKDDFVNVDWSYIKDKTQTLCFFDDHQNAVQRTINCHIRGFKHLMFEDNYPEGQGDCISLKKVLENADRYLLAPGVTTESYLAKIIAKYSEFPPIADLKVTRWGTPWSDYRSNRPLLESIPPNLSVFEEGMDQYTWINYVELV